MGATTSAKSGTDHTAPGFSGDRNVVYTLGTIEAIVVVDEATSIGTIAQSRHWTPGPGWKLNVLATLYVTQESHEAQEEDWDQPLSQVPTPQGVIEARGRAGVDVAAALEAGGPHIVFLTAPDPLIYPDLTVPWRIRTMARDTADGLVFVDSDGDALTEQWAEYINRLGDQAAVAAALARANERGRPDARLPEVAQALGANPSLKSRERELAIAIVDSANTTPFEADVMAVLAGYPWHAEGELYAASRDQAWHESSPEVRALDPELAPADVFRELEEWRVLLDLPADWDSDEYVEIRTPTGVADAASVRVGPHPTSVLARPSEPWLIYLTANPGNGEGKLIGTIARVPASSVGAVLLTFEVSTSGDVEVSADELTIEEATDLLASWFD